MSLILNGTTGITSPGGDTASASLATPILSSPSSLTLQTNGSTTAVTINTSQNVGIGTSSPSTALTVQTSGAQGALLATDLGNSNASSRLFLGYSGDTASLYYSTSGLVFGTSAVIGSTSGTQRLIIDPSGNLNIKTSNAGIVFNNSSALTNSTLNDYEVGTWTPVATSDSGSFTYTSNGTYTKIGRMVYLQGWVLLGTISSATGQLHLAGVPFANATQGPSGNDTQVGFTLRESQSSGNQFYGYFQGGYTTINVTSINSGAITWTSNWLYPVSLTYYTTF